MTGRFVLECPQEIVVFGIYWYGSRTPTFGAPTKMQCVRFYLVISVTRSVKRLNGPRSLCGYEIGAPPARLAADFEHAQLWGSHTTANEGKGVREAIVLFREQRFVKQYRGIEEFRVTQKSRTRFLNPALSIPVNENRN